METRPHPNGSLNEFISKTPQNTFMLVRDDKCLGGTCSQLEENLRDLTLIEIKAGTTLRLIFSHDSPEKLARRVFWKVGPDCNAFLALLSESIITPAQSLKPKKKRGKRP